MTIQTIYETERLLLKILDKSNAQIVTEYYLRNKSFLAEWEPVREPEFYTAQFREQELDKEFNNIVNGTTLKLWIVKKEDESKVIGAFSFNNIIRGAFLSCYLGYNLDEHEINQGYMTEALRKGIEIIFDEYKLHRIEASILPRNVRSAAVLEKLGFVNEGLSRDYLKINGKWEDHFHMVLLNDNL
jgi:ribosomal-protein-alanine N-acetyltransferase